MQLKKIKIKRPSGEKILCLEWKVQWGCESLQFPCWFPGWVNVKGFKSRGQRHLYPQVSFGWYILLWKYPQVDQTPEFDRDPGEYHITVLSCRQNPLCGDNKFPVSIPCWLTSSAMFPYSTFPFPRPFSLSVCAHSWQERSHSCSGPPLCDQPVGIERCNVYDVDTCEVLLHFMSSLFYITTQKRNGQGTVMESRSCSCTYPPVGVTSGRDHNDLIFEKGELLRTNRSAID